MRRDTLDQLIALLAESYQRMLEREERQRLRRSTGLPPDHDCISEPLERVRRGDITLAAFLDIKTDEAMVRLRGVLPDDDFRYVRAMVRDRIETDPLLMGLLDRLVHRPAQRSN